MQKHFLFFSLFYSIFSGNIIPHRDTWILPKSLWLSMDIKLRDCHHDCQQQNTACLTLICCKNTKTQLTFIHLAMEAFEIESTEIPTGNFGDKIRDLPCFNSFQMGYWKLILLKPSATCSCPTWNQKGNYQQKCYLEIVCDIPFRHR